MPSGGGDGGGGPAGILVPPRVGHWFRLVGDLRLDPLLQVSLGGGGGGISVEALSLACFSSTLSKIPEKETARLEQMG